MCSIEARFLLDDAPDTARFAWFKRNEGASPAETSPVDAAAGTACSSGAGEEAAGAGALTALTGSSSALGSVEWTRGVVLSSKARSVSWRDRGNDFAFGRAAFGATTGGFASDAKAGDGFAPDADAGMVGKEGWVRTGAR